MRPSSCGDEASVVKEFFPNYCSIRRIDGVPFGLSKLQEFEGRAMNRDDAMKELGLLLIRRRDALRSALKGDLSALRELNLASGDLADFALDAGCEEVTSQMAEVESRELLLIDDAISRYHSGEYGECEGCEKPIPLARLEALPYATLCIKCQIKLEKSGYKDWSELSDAAYDAIES